MQQPILSVGFAASAPLAEFDPASARLLLKRHDDNTINNELDLPLTTLAEKGFDGACLLIGNATLRLLHVAHPNVLSAHPQLVPPIPQVVSTEALIMLLISRSRRDRTDCYIGAIDALIQRLKDEPGGTGLAEQWTDIRHTLLDDCNRPAP